MTEESRCWMESLRKVAERVSDTTWPMFSACREAFILKTYDSRVKAAAKVAKLRDDVEYLQQMLLDTQYLIAWGAEFSTNESQLAEKDFSEAEA